MLDVLWSDCPLLPPDAGRVMERPSLIPLLPPDAGRVMERPAEQPRLHAQHVPRRGLLLWPGRDGRRPAQ